MTALAGMKFCVSNFRKMRRVYDADELTFEQMASPLLKSVYAAEPPWIVKSALICVSGVLSVTVVCADTLAAKLHIAIRAIAMGLRNRTVRIGEHTTFAIDPGLRAFFTRLRVGL